jgi:hypothetical protein
MDGIGVLRRARQTVRQGALAAFLPGPAVVIMGGFWHNFGSNMHHPQEKQPALQTPVASDSAPAKADATARQPVPRPREIGGRDGPEPTRYGDWEKAGRCIDF